jgi:hypothetical protein
MSSPNEADDFETSYGRTCASRDGSQDTISLLDHYLPSTNNLVGGDVKVG